MTGLDYETDRILEIAVSASAIGLATRPILYVDLLTYR